jgi:hypothetical protein
MRPVVSPREQALAAIDEYERQAQPLSKEDMQFLNRLRGATEVWRHMQKHRRTADDGARVIRHAVVALRAAKALPKFPIQNDRRKKLEEVKRAVQVVDDYFANCQGAEADELRRGLGWAKKFFKPWDVGDGLKVSFAGWLTEAEHTVAQVATALNSEAVPWPGREYRQPAGQRGMFMLCLSAAMREIFGKPCDSAVAALTKIAFEIDDTSPDQVRKARERHQQRNRTTRRKK